MYVFNILKNNYKRDKLDMKFDNEKRRFLTEKYARLESITLVQRACRANYKTKDAPARNTILNI